MNLSPSSTKIKKFIDKIVMPPKIKTRSTPMSTDLTIEEIDSLFENENDDLNSEEILSQNNKIIKGLFFMIKNFIDDSKKDKQKIEQLESEIENLNKKFIDIEYQSCKNKVRLHGVKLHSAAINEREKKTQSAEIFKMILKEMNCESVSYSDIFRIPNKNKAENENASDSKPPVLIANFNSQKDKNIFFKNLKNLKGSRNFSFQAKNDFPRSLNDRLKTLEKLAFEKRQKNFTTSIRFEHSNLFLYTKKQGQEFSLVKNI